MKTFHKKIVIVVTLILNSLLFTYCSVEEDSAVVEESNLVLEQETPENLTRTPILTTTVCDLNYVFPVDSSFGGVVRIIRYDSTLTLQEVHCIRYEYFQEYDYLKMNILQPSDDYLDVWTQIAEPDDDLDTTVCNDPRVENPNCDDD